MMKKLSLFENVQQILNRGYYANQKSRILNRGFGHRNGNMFLGKYLERPRTTNDISTAYQSSNRGFSPN